MDNDKIKMLGVFGIFTFFCIIVLIIMILTIRLSSNSWQKNLRQDVANALEEHQSDTWQIGDFIKMKSPIAQNAACFEAVNKTDSSKNYAIILRVQTIYGSFPAVFIYNEKSGASFIGFINLHGRINDMLTTNLSDSRLLYWQKRIPAIMQKALAEVK